VAEDADELTRWLAIFLARAIVMILSRLRSVSVRLAGDRGWFAGIATQVGRSNGQPVRFSLQ
jgi:hypothetical protein